MPIHIQILYLLVNFPMQLIAAVLMCTPLYKHRRRYFYVRLPICIVAYFALAYVFLYTPVADYLVTPHGITFSYLLLALLSMALYCMRASILPYGRLCFTAPSRYPYSISFTICIPLQWYRRGLIITARWR